MTAIIQTSMHVFSPPLHQLYCMQDRVDYQTLLIVTVFCLLSMMFVKFHYQNSKDANWNLAENRIFIKLREMHLQQLTAAACIGYLPHR